MEVNHPAHTLRTGPQRNSKPILNEEDKTLEETCGSLPKSVLAHLNSLSDRIMEIQEMCINAASECMRSSKTLGLVHPLQLSLSDVDDLYSLSSLTNNLVQSVRSQLDDVVQNVLLNSHYGLRNGHLWASFFTRDLERVIRSTIQQCTNMIEQRCGSAAYIQLGRVYAWARAQKTSTLDEEEEKEEPAQNMNHLRARLRRRLSRLVWLSRAGKRRARSHPLLLSLRHELLRIRTRATGRLLSDRTAAMGPTPLGSCLTSHSSLHEEDSETSLRQVVPSSFYPAFEQLIEKVTDLFLQLPSQIPGISVTDDFRFRTDRKQCWRALVSRTVLEFYTHSDVDEGMLDIHPFSAEEKADSLESEPDELEQQNPDPTVQKPISQLNPALVQAALDRFDHHSHANRKRAMPMSMDTYEDDRLASDKLTDSVPTVVDGQGEDILEALRRPVATAVKTITDLELNETGNDSNSKEPAKELTKPIDKEIPVADPPPVVTAAVVVTDTPRAGSAVSSKRESRRSLRTRRSRTPSENSFSEGEVLSDSEEERADSVEQMEDKVEEIGERINADIEEEEAEALIRMVNEQLRDATPASDIDLTELEIMDEWAPPSSSMLVAPRTENDDPNEAAMEIKESDESCTLSETIQSQIEETLREALEACGKHLEELVVKNLPPDSVARKQTSLNANTTPSVTISKETEASIERTASAFKEHVTSVLANLLHAVPVLANTNATDVKKDVPNSQSTAPTTRAVVTGRRGDGLLGMLRAYQQDVVKRMNSTVTGTES
ncbi:hypothetical protein PHET_05337 [Paragonimus heterotremus]|uniref:Uncharacterized protein n=1 Tax=Paragonimus heterotremus TaxID=100268 RepID=A0A8J4WRF4_9TREM|nr:hypothetical protein PHET_05337 [Paragonimus heterotremus]